MFMLFAEGLVPRPELLAVRRPESDDHDQSDPAAASELVLAGR